MPAQEGTAQSAGFIIISQSPDICKSPGAPIPYPSFAFLNHSITTSPDTNFQSFAVFHMGSRVTTVYGHEPGIGGGVVSTAYKGFCRPIVPVSTVFCNGEMLCRHEHTLFLMNCLGPNGTPNTIGKVYYLGAMLACDVGPNGAMPGGSNAVLQAETPKEPGFLDQIKDSLSINSIEDAVALSQRGFELSQVDWSNPSAALGALGGMAGRAGLGGLASAIGMGQTATNTDWKDPVSALKGAASMAGKAMDVDKSMNENFGFGLTDIAGKIWALPNTLLGVAIGGLGAGIQGIGYGLGMTENRPGLEFDHNAIGFTNNALVREGWAFTGGNAILYSPTAGPDTPSTTPGVTMGQHEQAHTQQSELLGPLYFPAWGVGAAIAMGQGESAFGDANFMEHGPYSAKPSAF